MKGRQLLDPDYKPEEAPAPPTASMSGLKEGDQFPEGVEFS